MVSGVRWPAPSTGAGWLSERSLVTKRCPSDTRSISIAIASTDASNRSSLWAVSVNTACGGPGLLDLFQSARAAAKANGNQIKTIDSTESVIISCLLYTSDAADDLL